MASLFDSDFGQKVDLCVRIREILRNYPEGSSVWKEILQNADDAGARRCVILLDRRQHGTGSLFDPKLSPFQGPAVLAYNDAEFSRRDFEAIQRIGDSLKKTERTGKTGRFGVGFNAVYHVTDVPSFVSGDRLILFDPQAEYVPKINPQNPGKAIDFLSARDSVLSCSDQVAPYAAFGCTFREPFHGTLFRFPLRTEEQASTSRLSHASHTASDIVSAFRDLARLGPGLLMFLKSVEALELQVWDPGASEARTLHSVALLSPSPALREARAMVCTAAASDDLLHEAAARGGTPCDHELDVRHESAFPEDAEDGRGPLQRGDTERWALVQQLGGGASSQLSGSDSFSEGIVPWAGVACPLGQASLPEGKAFCFLPLPPHTGLPVHVNGFFELSSNRRDIWFGDDMAGQGQLRTQWNEALLRDVVAPSYARLLLLARRRQGPISAFYALWPTGTTAAPWTTVQDALFTAAATQPLLCTSADAAAAVLATARGEAAPQGGDELPADAWARVDQCTLVNPAAQAATALYRFFSRCGRLAAVVPAHLHAQLVRRCLVRDEATPTVVRRALRSEEGFTAFQALARDEQLQCLEHAVSDLGPDSSALRNWVAAWDEGRRRPVSDVLPAATIGELAELPLLLALNGVWNRLMLAITPPRAARALMDMGFAFGTVWSALGALAAKRGVTRADLEVRDADMDLLLAQCEAEEGPAQASPRALLVPADGEEQAVFAEFASAFLVDQAALPDALVQVLRALSRGMEACNVRPLGPDVATSLLGPALLPSSVHGADQLVPRNVVRAMPARDVRTGFSRPWLARFWRYAMAWDARRAHASAHSAARGERRMSEVALALPLVPCSRGVVATLGTPARVLCPLGLDSAAVQAMGAVGALVHAPSSLAPAAAAGSGGGGLPGMGAAADEPGAEEEEDDQLLSREEAGALAQVLSDRMQPPVAAGAARCLAHALSSPLPSVEDVNASMRGVSGPQRRALRALLGGVEACEVTEAMAAAMAVLPLVEASDGTWRAPRDGVTVVRAPALPAGTESRDVATLEAAGPASWLSLLRVPVLSEAEWLRTRILPRLPSLPPDAAQRVARHALLHREVLEEEEAGFGDVLADTACVFAQAVEGAGKDARGPLCRPCDLYDPEVSELEPLLDAGKFPHAAFADAHVLAVLRALGLRTRISLTGIISCAQEVEDRVGDARGDPEWRARGEELHMRAMQLLAYFDTRFVGIVRDEVNALERREEEQRKKAAAAAAAAPQPAAEREESSDILRMLSNHLFSGGRSKAKSAPAKAAAAGTSQLSGAALIVEGASTAEEAENALSRLPAPVCSLLERLRRIRWLPVLDEAPEEGMPWPEQDATTAEAALRRRFADASATRPHSEAWFCSASRHLLKYRSDDAWLTAAMGWAAPLPPQVIASQLLALGERLPAEGMVRDEGRSVLEDKLAHGGVIRHLYSRLTARVGEEEQLRGELQPQLGDHPWVWVGRGFARAKSVALTCRVRAEPYLFPLPQELHPYADGLKKLGVRSEMSASDYVALLARLHDLQQQQQQQQGSSQPSGAARGGAPALIPLTDEMLDMVVLAVQLISDDTARAREWSVYAPDEDGMLALSSDLVYNNAPWIPRKRTQGMRFAHDKLSGVVCEKVGVRSLRREVLAGSSSHMELEGAEAFGQAESLTQRLSHILKQYPEGPGILYELLQNADDAGATRVKFMVSRKQFGTSSLLASSMEGWQGPALYCYNNSTFTERDMRSVVRIGQGAKFGRLATTGRFGLGFCSVYHFTDLPAFVTGESVVMFDPHGSHIPVATPAQPGLRIRFTSTNLRDEFPDQFEPFLYFGCNLRDPYDGTLFRFPLRTAKAAAQSQIKQQPETLEDVDAMLSAFAEGGAEALLFLRNVCRVELYVLDDEEGAEPVKLCDLGLEPEEAHGPTHATALTDFLGEDANQPELIRKRLEATPDDSLPSSSYVVRASRWTPAPRPSPQPHPRPAVPDSAFATYLVHAALGGGSALKMMEAGANSDMKMVPWGGVAARLSAPMTPRAEGEGDKAPSGRAFCFLPLPPRTGLPVHVNAYFELSSNRRDIWFGDDMAGQGQLRSQWNEALLRDVVAPAYANMVVAATDRLGPCDAYYALWPHGQVQLPWKIAQEAVLRRLADAPTLFRGSTTAGGAGQRADAKWMRPRDALLVSPDHECAEQLVDVLLRAGAPVAMVPSPLHAALLELGLVAGEVDPRVARQWLRGSAGRELVARQHTGPKRQLLAYVLQDVRDEATAEELAGIPLLPVDARGNQFTTFERFSKEDAEATCRSSRSESLDAPPKAPPVVFLPSTTDRPLLKIVSDRCVPPTLPDELRGALERVARLETLNVVQFGPEKAGLLLRVAVPAAWVGRTSVPMPAQDRERARIRPWLQQFWSFLVTHNALESVVDTVPLVPTKGSQDQLRVLTHDMPILLPLHEKARDDVQRSLVRLGLELLDVDRVPALALVPLKQYCQRMDASGVVDALFALYGAEPGAMEALTLTRGDCEQLLNFFVRSSLGRQREIKGNARTVLVHLPIFPVGTREYRDKFVSLRETRFVPPPKIATNKRLEAFLNDPKFLRTHRDILELAVALGAIQLSEADFFLDHVFPTLHSLQPALLHDLMRHALTHFAAMAEEGGEIHQRMAELPFVVPEPALAGTLKNDALKKATDLYDPGVLELWEILPKASFPSTHMYPASPMATLRELGLRKSLDLPGLVEAARAIHEGVERAERDPQRAPGGGPALSPASRAYAGRLPVALTSRADALCRYCNMHADALFGRGDRSEAATAELDKCVEALKSLRWVAVSTKSLLPLQPRVGATDEARHEGGRERLGVVTPKEAWPAQAGALVSASRHLVHETLTAPALLTAFEWAQTPPMPILCEQLRALCGVLRTREAEASLATEDEAPRVQRDSPAATRRASRARGEGAGADQGEPAADAAEKGPSASAMEEGGAATAEGGEGAAPGDRGGDSSEASGEEEEEDDEEEWSDASAEEEGEEERPSLRRGEFSSALSAPYGTRQAAARSSNLHRLLHDTVPEVIAAMHRHLAPSDGDEASPRQAASHLRDTLGQERCVWTGTCFALPSECVLVWEEDLRPAIYPVAETMAGQRTVLRAMGVQDRVGPAQLATAVQRLPRTRRLTRRERHTLRTLLRALVRQERRAQHKGRGEDRELSLSRHGEMLLLARDGVARPAATLVVVDADWLASDEQLAEHPARYVHPSCSQFALAAGAESLLQTFVSRSDDVQDLRCPSAAAVQGFLARHADDSHPPTRMLWSAMAELVAAAARLGARSVSLEVDRTEYGHKCVESRGMRSCQGPSLVLHCPGLHLDARQLVEALSQEEGGDPSLLSAFRFGDVLQVMSGTLLMTFDPCGQVLEGRRPKAKAAPGKRPARARGEAASSQGRGRAINFVGADICRQFSDQFAPFFGKEYGAEPDHAADGVVLRVPLLLEDNRFVAKAPGGDEGAGPTAAPATALAPRRWGMRTVVTSAHTFGRVGGAVCVLGPSKVRQLAVAMRGAERGEGGELQHVRRVLCSVGVRRAKELDTAWESVGPDHDKEWQGGWKLTSFFRRSSQPTAWTHNVELDVEEVPSVGPRVAPTARVETWRVSAALAPGESRKVAQELSDSLQLRPWVGVAMRVWTGTGQNPARPLRGIVSSGTWPAPVPTGLPFHLLGGFAATGGVVDPPTGSGGDSDGARWNASLISSGLGALVPLALQQLVTELEGGAAGSGEEGIRRAAAVAYGQWPSTMHVEDWLRPAFPAAVHEQLARNATFLSATAPVRFLPAHDGMFPCADLPESVRTFVSRHKSIFATPGRVLRDVRLAEGARAGRGEGDSLELAELTPSGLRALLRGLPHHGREIERMQMERAAQGAGKEAGGEAPLALDLLLFCLADSEVAMVSGPEAQAKRRAGAHSSSSGAAAGAGAAAVSGAAAGSVARGGDTAARSSAAAGDDWLRAWQEPATADEGEAPVESFGRYPASAVLRELEGLTLLPLVGGKVGTMHPQKQYLIATVEQSALMPSLAGNVVSEAAAARLQPIIEHDSWRKALGLFPVTPPLLARNMPRVLNGSWHARAFVRMPSGDEPGGPGWLAKLWREVSVNNRPRLDLFRDWPLLPVCGGRLMSCRLRDAWLHFPGVDEGAGEVAGVSEEPHEVDELWVEGETLSSGAAVGAGQEEAGAAAGKSVDAGAAFGTFGSDVDDDDDDDNEVSSSLNRPAVQRAGVRTLHRLGFPAADCSIVPEVPVTQDGLGIAVVKALGLLARETDETGAPFALHWEDADEGMARSVLAFLSSELVGNVQVTDAERQVVMGLPLHRTLAGQRASSSTDAPLYRLADGVSMEQVLGAFAVGGAQHNKCPAAAQICARILAPDPGLAPFYDAMGVKALSLAPLLHQLVLPAFERLAPAARASVRTHMRAHAAELTQGEDADRLRDRLRETPLLSAGGTCMKPGDLLDPSEPLLAAVFADTPERFPELEDARAGHAWLSLLRRGGMRGSLDASLALECAQHLEQRFSLARTGGDTATAGNVLQAAAALHQHMWQNSHAFMRQDFLQRLSHLRCVPAMAHPGEASAVIVPTPREVDEQPASAAVPGARREGGEEEEGGNQVPACDPGLLQSLDLGGERCGERTRWTLTSYRECGMERDEKLLWLVCPVLPDAIAPTRAQDLGLASPPPVRVVATNLMAIGMGQACRPEAGDGGGRDEHLLSLEGWRGPDRVEATVLAILTYLQEHMDEMDRGMSGRLRRLPFIPVGSVAVSPVRAFFSLPQPLSPFLFEVSRALGSAERFLRAAGVEDRPTAEKYAQVLDAKHASARGAPLNTNELRSALQIIRFIADAADEERQREQSARSGGGIARGLMGAVLSLASRPREEPGIRVRWLPDRRGVLAPAEECLVNDAPWIVQRVDPARVRVAHALVGRSLWRRLRLRRLSEAVRERLHPSNGLVPVTLDTEGAISARLPGGVAAVQSAVQQSVTSPEFATGVAKLVEAARDDESGAADGEGEGEEEEAGVMAARRGGGLDEAIARRAERVHAALKGLRVVLVDRLRSQFLLLSPRGRGGRTVARDVTAKAKGTLALIVTSAAHAPSGEGGEGAAGAAAAAQKGTAAAGNGTVAGQGGQRERVLYIAAGSLPRGVTVEHALAQALARELAPVLRPGAGERALDDLLPLAALVGSPPAEVPAVLSALRIQPDHEAERQRLRGVPGLRLHPADEASRELRPSREFMRGEVVVWEDAEGVPRYGVVADCGEASGAGNGAAAVGGALRNVRVQTSMDAEPQWMLSSHVWFLGSAQPSSEEGEGGGGADAGDVLVEVDSDSPANNAPSEPVPAPSEAVQAPAASRRPQRVDSQALMQAAREMLARAGAPMDAGAEERTSAFLQLREELESTRGRLAEALEDLRSTAEREEVRTNALLCPICYAEPLERVLVPCGHQLCSSCLQSLPRRVCPTCRVNLTGEVPFINPSS